MQYRLLIIPCDAALFFVEASFDGYRLSIMPSRNFDQATTNIILNDDFIAISLKLDDARKVRNGDANDPLALCFTKPAKQRQYRVVTGNAFLFGYGSFFL